MTRTPDAPTRSAVGLRSERGPVLASVMVTTGLVALDSTIIATAVPSVVSDLGGFSQFPWLFSVYLLAQAVTVPLYGRLSDMIGRKPVMFVGIGMFLLGSVLCGSAWNMTSLIAFRAVQGIGAGAVLPMSITIVGDLYSVQERARVQGYIASVWGVASVIGPTVGGVFSEYLSWRWIFFVNLPLGAAAVMMLGRRFHERITPTKHSIDYAGAALLTISCSLLILGLLEGGVAWAWSSTPSTAILGVGAVLLVVFIFVERRAREPVLPLWVFGRRTLAGGNLVALTVGAVLIGLSSYVPTYAQGVLGTGALVAGFALAALTVGWPITAGLSGRLYLRIGFRNTALIGAGFVLVGTVLGTQLSAAAEVWQVGGACLVIGAGLGLVSSPTVVAVQSVVGWERRGVVTGTNLFCRSIGSAVGAAIFGAIANTTLADRFAHPTVAVAGQLPDSVDATSLVLDGGSAREPGVVSDFIRLALYDAIHHVFLALVIVAMVAVAALLIIPRRTVPLVFAPSRDAGAT